MIAVGFVNAGVEVRVRNVGFLLSAIQDIMVNIISTMLPPAE